MKNIILLALVAFLLSACGPSPTYTQYVATTGNDAGPCTSESMPCRTLAGALENARELHASLTEAGGEEPPNVTYIVNVAAGTYLEEADADGEPFAQVDFNINIFGAGMDVTVFDAGGAAGGMLFEGNAEIILKDFTIQNVIGRSPIGFFPEGCIHLLGSVHGLIESVKLDNCLEAGFVNNSDTDADNPIQLVDSIVSNTGTLGTGTGFSGHGVVNAGALSVTNSTVSSSRGQGVVSTGNLLWNGGLIELNDHNGLLLSGEARLLDITIRRNGQSGCLGACADASPAGIKIQDPGSVVLTGVSISRNLFGIKLDHPDALLLLENSAVNLNQLSGVLVIQGTFTAQESSINSNSTLAEDASAGYTGPAIVVYPNGSALLREVHVDNNLNGGIFNRGGLTLVDTSVSGNQGFALYNADGSANLENTLIANNIHPTESVFNGAIVNTTGLIDLLNVTISHNTGFGLQNQAGNATIAYSTIAFHSYGLLLESGASTAIKNSLIAANLGPNCLGDGVSELVDIGFNLSTNELGSSSCGFSTPFYNVDELLLGELSDNGGFTMTHALLEGSPAINAAFGDCPIGDQRSAPRPFGDACDIGAYEASDTTLSLSVEAGATATAETTGETGIYAIPDQNYNCREGNSSLFEIADTLLKDEKYIPLGIGQDKLWLQFSGPAFGTKCWAPTEGFTFYLNGFLTAIEDLPADLLQVVPYPPVVTPTPDPDESYDAAPTATCYYNQQQQYICP